MDEEKVIFPETKADLLRAINNITPGQIIELNNYVIESDLEIVKKNNFSITPLIITQIKGDTRVPVIENPETTRSGLILNDCENVTIDGLTLILTNKSAHYPGIISLYKCSNVEIKNCNIRGSAEYGIYIHSSCSNIQIRRNTIKGYRQYGCFTEYGNSVFEKNRYDNSNEVFVENIRLTKNDVMQIYKESLKYTSHFMYDDDYYPILDFNTDSLGMYMGTPGHIEYDSGMSFATSNFFEVNGLTGLGSDFFPILMELISGIPVYVPPDKRDSESPWHLDDYEMPYYNPEFIRWAGKNLVPETGDRVAGLTFQQIYDHCYKRFFRVLAETYLYIQYNLNIRKESYHLVMMILKMW